MRKKSIITVLCLLAVAGVDGFALAGSLEPPGSPAPTMVTLQQIYDKLDQCTGAESCGVPKTGQVGCWDENGVPIECAGTGQDGEYQEGVSVDPRFIDNHDGTIADALTGLVWLQDANCFGNETWLDSLTLASTLADGSCGLTDGSVAGDWRLPNARELLSLIELGYAYPALDPSHSFVDVSQFFYWTSTTRTDFPLHAWGVGFNLGGTATYTKTGVGAVILVRSAQ